MKNSGASTPDYVYEYHWDRILLAIISIAVLLGLVLYLWLATADNDAPTNPAALATMPMDETDTQIKARVAATSPASETPVTTVNPEALPLNAALLDTSELAAETHAESSVDAPASNNLPSNPLEAANGQQINAADSHTQTPTSEPALVATQASENAATIAAAPSATQPPTTGTRTKAELFTAAIKRAKLTTQVVKLEPGLELPADYKGNPEELSKVYFYTEVIGQAGKTHYHHWYHNGKLAAKVPIAIGSDRWRCYSSKYLSDAQSGDWEVKVIDGKGRLLAQSEFHFSGEE